MRKVKSLCELGLGMIKMYLVKKNHMVLGEL